MGSLAAGWPRFLRDDFVESSAADLGDNTFRLGVPEAETRVKRRHFHGSIRSHVHQLPGTAGCRRPGRATDAEATPAWF